MTKLHDYQKRILKEFRKRKSFTIEINPCSDLLKKKEINKKA
jgi:hypothetical protein